MMNIFVLALSVSLVRSSKVPIKILEDTYTTTTTGAHTTAPASGEHNTEEPPNEPLHTTYEPLWQKVLNVFEDNPLLLLLMGVWVIAFLWVLLADDSDKHDPLLTVTVDVKQSVRLSDIALIADKVGCTLVAVERTPPTALCVYRSAVEARQAASMLQGATLHGAPLNPTYCEREPWSTRWVMDFIANRHNKKHHTV